MLSVQTLFNFQIKVYNIIMCRTFLDFPDKNTEVKASVLLLLKRNKDYIKN
jgi:hypothetical protein